MIFYEEMNNIIYKYLKRKIGYISKNLKIVLSYDIIIKT